MKFAYCIGIAKYDFLSSLRNPNNDALDMSTSLSNLGFDVTTMENPDRITLWKGLNTFKEKSSDGIVSLIYYAGHGVQSNGINYLLPKDANPQNEQELEIFGIPLDKFINMDSVEDKINIIILDACRNDPFKNKWTRNIHDSGLAQIIAPSGTLIAFSTSPGKSASDGFGTNGLYTEALLTELYKTDLSIIQMFQNVRQKVLYNSNNNQLPWESTSLLGDFYLNPKRYNPTDFRIINIRKKIADTRQFEYTFAKTSFDVIDESPEGGILSFFTDKNSTKLIRKQLYFESGQTMSELILNSGKPIYFRNSMQTYNVPFYITEEGAKEMGCEPFDFNKSTTKIDEYFIENEQVIGHNQITDSKETHEQSNLYEEIAKDINSMLSYIQTKNNHNCV